MLDDHGVQLHRKARLRELIDNACGGVIARMADRIRRSESYLGRMLYSPEKLHSRPVSDKLALLIEHEFGLARGWFDLPTGEALPYPTLPIVTPDQPAIFGQPRVEDTKDRVSADLVWPFHLVSYRRLRAVTAALGKRAPEAMRDMDAQLDIVLTKWEREITKENSRRA